MTEFQCVAIRGCCFDGDAPFRVPQCFKPNGPGQFNYDSSKIPEAYKAGKIRFNVHETLSIFIHVSPFWRHLE